MERKGLGRGLSALLADVATVDAGAGSPVAARAVPGDSVPIDRIRANPNQPRQDFDEKELADLAASIREKGVIQPLILRPHPVDAGDYEIVAGERRWRAAQLAGVHALPAVVRDALRRRGARARDHRERAARRPQPARGGAGLPAADGPLRPHPGAAGRGARQEPQPHRQPAAAADPARAGARHAARRPPDRRSRPGPRHRDEPGVAGAPGGRPRPLGPPDRGARPRRGAERHAARRCRARRRRTPTPARSRRI